MRGSIRSDLVKQLRRPSDLYRGKLAEDYDGIGQYVLVSMSRGSTAAALRARIAAGDFGGSRVFPVGTPVVMHSAHGQLEVLSLGNLRGCPRFDNFPRTIAATKKRNTYPGTGDPVADNLVAWGVSDYGEPWHVHQYADPTQGGQAGVINGYGFVKLHSSTDDFFGAWVDTIPKPTDKDFLLTIRFRLRDDTPFDSAGGFPFRIEMFNGEISFRINAKSTSSWTAREGPGTPVDISGVLGEWMIAQIDWTVLTTTFRMKAWLESGVEPNWLLSYNSGFNPTASPQLSIIPLRNANSSYGEYVEAQIDYVEFDC